MRKTILGLVAALAVVFAAATPADAGHKRHHYLKKPVVIGAVVGTVVGVAVYEGWWTSSALGVGVTGSVGASATVGLLAGIGTATLIHASTTKCVGFHALFAGKGCKGGKYVGR